MLSQPQHEILSELFHIVLRHHAEHAYRQQPQTHRLSKKPIQF